jgi:hypothetical protein
MVNYILNFIVVTSGIVLFTFNSNFITDSVKTKNPERIETFTFSSNGESINGKIYLPSSFETNNNLPAIYLIDFHEQHFAVATDEFEKTIQAVRQINGSALVVTLEEHLDVSIGPGSFQEYYTIFKDLTIHVDSKYTNNTSRTFIGKGSEGGLVLMTLFNENPEFSVFDNYIATDADEAFNRAVTNMIGNDDFPKNKQNKKLHYSFSTSNDHDLSTNLIEAISEAQYPWLQFETKEYTNSNYENTYPAAFTAGIRYIFDD